nr:MAG TPA: hypothetical protein [Microviridae sp.]
MCRDCINCKKGGSPGKTRAIFKWQAYQHS